MIYDGSHDAKSLSDYEISKIIAKNNNDNVAMNCKYLKCDINEDAKTFGELFHQPKKYNRQNSCMFNAIMNCYEKSFEKSDHKDITYNVLCKMIITFIYLMTKSKN